MIYFQFIYDRVLKRRREFLVLIAFIMVTACSDGTGRLPERRVESPESGAVALPEGSTAPFLLSFGSWLSIATDNTNEIGPVVLSCTVYIREGQGCSFETLPLIGMESSNPTIDQVMSRVVVSHDWMRVRFREILELMPTEVLLLMRGLTAIVISYDIRPSFYYPYSGAIYLDPDGMWLTEVERAVIDQTPDYRSDFGSELQFIMLWRYVQGNTNLRQLPRDLQQVSIDTAALLFHELAHANDFFAPSRMSTMDRTVAPVDTITAIESDRLAGTYPLSSSVMHSLANVSFKGVRANDAQKLMTSVDIASEFPSDTANDYYNYTTQFEDFAMAFEEAMLYYSFGISRDVAVTNFPAENICEQYLVAWGQRNRIGDPSVQARSIVTIRAILPELADQIEASLANVPAPTQMIEGVNWCDNITLSEPLTPAQRILTMFPESPRRPVEHLLPYQ